MRKVNVTTAQNIVIDFRLATIGQRLLAFIIDMMVVGTVVLFMFIFISIINETVALISLLVFILYTLIMELLFSGQTLGKMALKIKVLTVDGKEPNPLDFVIRWSFRLLDIWFSIGALAVVSISTSQRGQRLGGVLSNSMVVNLNAESNLTLKDILKIEDRSKYKPKFRDVIRFNEDEMLTIKAVLDRYSKYHNKAHLALLDNTAMRCAEVLELRAVPDDKTVFLRTLIKDYIVLTRS
ncbi:MAG: RDD family protein [Bacteroidota bacterium]